VRARTHTLFKRSSLSRAKNTTYLGYTFILEFFEMQNRLP